MTFLDNCIADTIRNIEAGKVSVEDTDHLATQTALVLSPQQVAFLDALPLLSFPFPCSLSLPHGKGGLDEGTARRLRLTRRERQFAEVLLVLAAYERSKHYRKTARPTEFLATNQQMIDLLKARHGVDLAPTNDNEGAGKRQLRRLKEAFVTMAGRPAGRAELMVLKQVGVRGTPSVYTLTGLLGALTE